MRAVMGSVTDERDDRPWGHYEVLEDASTHKMKRIEVSPGRRLSYQRHARRAEHWFIVSRTAEVTLEDAVHVLAAGQAIDIRAGPRIASPTPALTDWSSSRCSTVTTSAKTTSSGWTTISVALADRP
jgi:hypothetical protein